MTDALTFTFTPDPATFSVEPESRTIRGLAVPYGKPATSRGQQWMFSQGTLDFSRAKMLIDHEGKAIGKVAEVNDRTDGAHVALSVARGAAGDEALQLAEDGVYDGLSIGLGPDVKASRGRDGVNRVSGGTVREVTTTAFPSFDDARVTSVAMGATTTKEAVMPEENTNAPAGGEITAPVFSDEQVNAMVAQIKDQLNNGQAEPDERPVIPAAPGAQFAITEQPMYRFDGHKGQHEFSTDLFAALRGDRESHARIDEFVGAQFADVTSGDVSGVNPNKYRPDLYVGSDPVVTPIFDALYKGGLTDGTPFVAPKFSSASGLVSDHTEGTEPTGGDWSATSQTVTPSAVSGEVDITREVIDAGGSPQVSGLIWAEIQKAYAKSMETKSAALLTGAAVSELGTAPTAGDADSTLVGEVTANLGTLPFLSYGSEFGTNVYTHVDLYSALIAAKDGNNRPLLALLGPANANGSAAERLQSVGLAGYRFLPASSLGVTKTKMKSFIFDPSFGGVWASNAQRITLNPTVAYGAKIGVFGYIAKAVLNSDRVRKITYNPSAA
ncbi:MAG: hypothetical protein ACRDQA_03465 [Nocardioidaceae bacterium]